MTSCSRASWPTTRPSRGLAALALLSAAATGLAQAAYPQNPLVLDGAIYVSHEGAYRFDDGQAEPRWQALAGIETYAPVAHGELLLIGSTRGLYALERASGAIRWRIEPTRTLFSPAVGRDAYAGSLHGELYAIRIADGTIRWRREFDGWIYSPAISRDGARLWSGGQMHALTGLAADDGRPLARIETRAESVFSPLDLGDDRAAFNLFDGSTRFLDMTTGTPLAEIPGSAQPSGLRRVGGSIFRVDRAGGVLSIDATSLAPRWQLDLATRDLALHPSRAGNLLVSDIDRNLYLVPTAARAAPCRLETTQRWLKAWQLADDAIGYFEKRWNPPGLTPVVHFAQCNQPHQGSSK